MDDLSEATFRRFEYTAFERWLVEDEILRGSRGLSDMERYLMRDAWYARAKQSAALTDMLEQQAARIAELEAAQLLDEPTATMIAAMLGWREIDLGDIPYTKGDGDIRMVWAMYEALRRHLKGARNEQA